MSLFLFFSCQCLLYCTVFLGLWISYYGIVNLKDLQSLAACSLLESLTNVPGCIENKFQSPLWYIHTPYTVPVQIEDTVRGQLNNAVTDEAVQEKRSDSNGLNHNSLLFGVDYVTQQ